MKDQYVQLMKDISKYDKKNQEAIIRCIFHGKLDNLFNYKRKLMDGYYHFLIGIL